ncbi:hypothetical protein MNB_SV-13-425 [hydrothermal vent metagenome]|uniref:TIGR02646 family protein n=1 Tax=hydrothermal vent metagenome TaxID=652676 RepID=A0A1W1BID9_9ZZZZ
MRKINKLTPLADFNGDNYNRDCTTWKCFHEKYKEIFYETRFQILVDEQNQQCGYTEIYINNEEESHIDHYVKQEYNQNLKFDWNNYIVATKDNNFGANYKDNTYKIQKSEYALIFNPIFDTVEEHFYYDEFGMIIEDEGKVQKTIEVFNLNHSLLKFKRKQIISLIEYFKNDGLSNLEIKFELEDYGFKSIINQYCKEEN